MEKARPVWKARNSRSFMTTLNDYLSFFDKVNKRIRDEQITELLPKLAVLRPARRF